MYDTSLYILQFSFVYIKNMRNLIICTFFLLSLTSCRKDDLYYQSDTGLTVFIVNAKNENLLGENSAVSNRIDVKKLAILSSGNNDKKPSPGEGKLTPDIFSPDLFRVEVKGGEACLALIFDPGYSESNLQINYNDGSESDMLTADLVNKNGKVTYDKIYLNKTLIWKADTNKERSITIRKHKSSHTKL